MKKILIAAAVGMLVAGSVAAQESPWLVRARAVHIVLLSTLNAPKPKDVASVWSLLCMPICTARARTNHGDS